MTGQNQCVSFYRDKYLKSDHWKDLRVAVLARQKCRCQICGSVSESNDVHHLKYRHLYDVTPQDLRLLCRDCHERVHSLLEKYPKMKVLPRAKIWKTVKDHLQKDVRDAHWLRNQQRAKNRKINKVREKFVLFRTQLVIAGKVSKSRMPWQDSLAECAVTPTTAEEFLEYYMLKTECDPRRRDNLPVP